MFRLCQAGFNQSQGLFSFSPHLSEEAGRHRMLGGGTQLGQPCQPSQRAVLDQMVPCSGQKLGRSCLGAAARGLSGRWEVELFVHVTAKALLRIKGNVVTILPKNLYQVYSIKEGKKRRGKNPLALSITHEIKKITIAEYVISTCKKWLRFNRKQ